MGYIATIIVSVQAVRHIYFSIYVCSSTEKKLRIFLKFRSHRSH